MYQCKETVKPAISFFKRVVFVLSTWIYHRIPHTTFLSKIAFKQLTLERKQVAYEWYRNINDMVSSIWVFLNDNPLLKCAPAPPTCTLSPEKELWSKLFNIFLELFSISLLVSYGMHCSRTSKYDNVYLLNRETNPHTNHTNNKTV